MEFAVLARPQWRSPVHGKADEPLDPRIILAPLQELELITTAPTVLQHHLASPNAWLVLTSPASVLALKAHTDAHALSLSNAAVNFVAVGAGTRDQLCKVFPWLQSENILISRHSESADASSTLEALDRHARESGLDWPSQKFLVIEGQDNRATLREGLAARTANVNVLVLYKRIQVNWPEPLWSRLAQSAQQQAGIVITSTAVIEPLLQAMELRSIDPRRFYWCTQHAAIATRLADKGLGPVGRVRLDAKHITDDLFTHGHHW